MTATDVGLERSSLSSHRDVDVLLVDDRQENLLALEAILDPLGLHLIRATSGEEALREVLRRDLAVILLDVQMPGMNGFETAKVIKSRERSRHIPIIFLTAISKEEQYVFEGYSVGAVDYLSKPFHPDVLRSKVSVFVELHEKSRQIRDQGQQLRLHERREIELHHRARHHRPRARREGAARSGDASRPDDGRAPARERRARTAPGGAREGDHGAVAFLCIDVARAPHTDQRHP